MGSSFFADVIYEGNLLYYSIKNADLQATSKTTGDFFACGF
jgi:hypothetical protein